jgi:hypothetical protein
MSTIKISELNTFPSALTTADFFPIDKSSSLLTYRATLGQLQSLLSTGSFSGSLIGTLTGTASWANNAISSSYTLTSSYANNSISSSYAVTASYISGSGGLLSGTGTAQYFTKWSNTNVLTDADFYYDTNITSNVSSKNILIYKNTPQLIVTGSGQSFASVISTFNSSLVLGSATTASDAVVITCGADGNHYSSPGWGRGGIELSSYTSSNNFTWGGKDYSGDNLQYGQVRLLRIRSNGWYFWPLTGVQSVSRDGTFNIGVDSGEENHETRLKIAVFSGSSAAPQTVDHLQKAIEVSYGSGSAAAWPVTFCVSSSGKTYVGGTLEVNAGLKLKSDTYLSITGANQIVSLNSEDYGTKYIELAQNGTASITMSQGGQLNVIVNQAFNNASAWNANIYFTGSFLSSSGATFNCPIVWKTGTQPAITTGTANRADFFTFYSVNTSNLGPKGSGATNNTVIYAVATQNMF